MSANDETLPKFADGITVLYGDNVFIYILRSRLCTLPFILIQSFMQVVSSSYENSIGAQDVIVLQRQPILKYNVHPFETNFSSQDPPSSLSLSSFIDVKSGKNET